MYAWEQIQKTVDYIEEHLGETIQIEELAQIAALSPFYFQRLFSRLIHKPVAEYIKLRRMAKASEELLQSDRRILDIAVELGFTSHEHFSRSFKKTFRVTPEEFRKNPQRMNHMTKPQLMLNYVLIDEGVPLITEGIILEVNRRQLDKNEYYAGFEKTLPVSFIEGLGVESGEDPLDNLWNNFHEKKEASKQFLADGDEIGVTHSSEQEGHFTYFAGGKIRETNPEKDYQLWTISQGEYIVCSFEAENFEALVMDTLYKAQQYLYGVWLPKHEVKTLPYCIEKYARHDAQANSMEIWLPVLHS